MMAACWFEHLESAAIGSDHSSLSSVGNIHGDSRRLQATCDAFKLPAFCSLCAAWLRNQLVSRSGHPSEMPGSEGSELCFLALLI